MILAPESFGDVPLLHEGLPVAGIGLVGVSIPIQFPSDQHN